MKLRLLAFLVSSSLATLAFAETPSVGGNRYSLLERNGKVIRMDNKTGAVSICDSINGALACRAAADERESWQQENAALSQQVRELSERLAALESSQPEAGPKENGTANTNKTPGKEGGEADGYLSKKNREKVDQAMEKAEYFLRRFIDVAKKLSEEFQTQ